MKSQHPTQVRVAVYLGRNGWRWRIKRVRNWKVIGASTQGYARRIDALDNLDLLTGISLESQDIEWPRNRPRIDFIAKLSHRWWAGPL